MAHQGRKTKLTREIQEKIISVIRAGNYACVAAQYAGVTERTYYRWLEKGETRPSSVYGQFRQAVKAAESEAEVRAVAIIQNLMPNNWQAAMAYLERKYPYRWGRRIPVSVDPRRELSQLGLDPEEVDAAIEEAAKS